VRLSVAVEEKIMPDNKRRARKLPGSTSIIRSSLEILVITLLLSSGFPSIVRAAAGDLDPTFGNGGRVLTSFSFFDGGNSVALQSDGKIVVAGVSGNPVVGPDFTLLRYNPDGTIDSTFGSGGRITNDFPGENEALAVAVQPDGKIIAAGRVNNDMAILRYDSNGALDPTFGVSGQVITDVPGFGQLRSLIIQPDGKIIGVGSSGDGFGIARYNSNGSLDSEFGSGGIVTVLFKSSISTGSSGALQPDGKIVVAGFQNAGAFNFALARLESNGNLDTSFGTNGKVTTSLFSITDLALSVAIQGDGKIVAGGETFSHTTLNDFALVRYNADGGLDSSFGAGGKVITDFMGSTDRIASVL
jgi:uncharacterized delta-60 repeat protein